VGCGLVHVVVLVGVVGAEAPVTKPRLKQYQCGVFRLFL
jgi:hypothetical protein